MREVVTAMRVFRPLSTLFVVFLIVLGAAAPAQANRVRREFLIPTIFSRPVAITKGPDGNLWFTESDGNNIGLITKAGVITEFPVPTAASKPEGITEGP